MLIVPFDMDSAGDARGFARALAKVRRAAGGGLRQLAVVAKIEGTATLNDRSRELASACFRAELDRCGGASLRRRTLEILSVGCEGIITPGGTLFASVAPRRARASDAPGLVMGHGRSAALPMRDRASLRHVGAAERAVRAAMRAAGLSARQSAFVLIKSPVRVDGARPTEASRGAAALGAAVALGELSRSRIRADSLLRDATLYGTRTMAFSGTETDCCEAVVFGHRPGGDPAFRLERAMLADLLDVQALAPLADAQSGIVSLFLKAGIPQDGRLRGERTTVLTSELPASKQLRAAASGLVAAVFRTTRVFGSGGAEHQAPPGGCLGAAIVRR
jgi:cyanuric acid amidohydrolase